MQERWHGISSKPKSSYNAGAARRGSQAWQRAWQFIASRGLAIGLFGAICLVSLPGTFSDRTSLHPAPLFIVLFGLLGLNVVACTLQRIRSIPRPVLIMHAGAVVTIAGAAMTSLGFVATANIYEGTSIDAAYRWDREQDVPLGVDVRVDKINMEYYPVRVRVGVLRGKEKFGLFELMTEESFPVGAYRVRVDGFEYPSETLRLSVFQGDRYLGRAQTEGGNDLPPDFPYSFVLVAYKNPSPRRMWVDLTLSQSGKTVAEGIAEVNNPLDWQGLRFYHVRTERDPYGNAYAGMQITRDPGRPVVYAGFTIIAAGALFWTYRKIGGRRK